MYVYLVLKLTHTVLKLLQENRHLDYFFSFFLYLLPKFY